MYDIGANSWIWFSPPSDVRLSELVPRLAAWGFDLVEIPVEEPGGWDPTHVRQLIDANGLRATVCAVMGPDRDLTGQDPAQIVRTQDYLRHCIEVAAALGSPVVGGPIYAPVGKAWRQAPAERELMVADLAVALEPVAEHASRHGVVLGIEPLNRFETSVINTTEQALDLVGRVPSDGIGLMLDTFHLNIEEPDVPAAIRMAGDHLVHLQVCANDRGVPGRDHLDWPGIVDALQAIDYAGALAIESFTGDNDVIATAASIWRPLAEHQDDIAVEGLRFLRELLASSDGEHPREVTES